MHGVKHVGSTYKPSKLVHDEALVSSKMVPPLTPDDPSSTLESHASQLTWTWVDPTSQLRKH